MFVHKNAEVGKGQNEVSSADGVSISFQSKFFETEINMKNEPQTVFNYLWHIPYYNNIFTESK